MKKRNSLFAVVAAFLALALLLSACGTAGEKTEEPTEEPAEGPAAGNEVQETVQTADTLAGVREMVNAFYGQLEKADVISMTSAADGESTVFVKDGDRMYLQDAASDTEYYLFIEDGVKYCISDGETACEDEFMYDLWGETLEFTLAMYVTGIFELDDEDAGDIVCAATRTDRTVDGATTSELVYTVTAEDEGETATLTVDGRTGADGRVSEIDYKAVSDGETYQINLRFAYDGVSVTLPAYVIDRPLVLQGEHVESPYETVQELIDTLREDEHLSYSLFDGQFFAIAEKDGRYYKLTAPISEEDTAALEALDFFADDYTEQVYAILGKLPVEDCFDFTDAIPTQEELDVFTGKTVGELVEAGFEGAGWSIWEEEAYLYFNKDYMSFEAKATIPEGFDADAEFEFEDLYDFVVEQLWFTEPEYPDLPTE